MLGRSSKISSTCLTPLSTTPWQSGLSLAAIVVMAAAMTVPADAKIIVVDAIPAEEPAAIGAAAFPFNPHSEGKYLLAQSAAPPLPGGTLICEGGEGGRCVGISFPRPGGDGPPEDGGVPPQAGSPSLTVPDLLVTKPRVAPDLEGRFSNGGNEEIW